MNKYFVIAIAFLLNQSCYAQVDTLPTVDSSYRISLFTMRGEKVMSISDPDTVRVMMLMSDTIKCPSFVNTVRVGDRKKERQLIIHNNTGKSSIVFWQYGYVVYQVNMPLVYLGRKKKRLPPNLIVWMHKDLEPCKLSFRGF